MTARLDQEEKYNDYLKGMKEAHRQSMSKAASRVMSPRVRHRHINEVKPVDQISSSTAESERALIEQNTRRISTIASMVPDEIISLQHRNDSSIQRYESVLMFIDVSGFTDLCEAYTRAGHEGPSRLTQVLNTYIGAMVQEILAHDGDVLQFSGDAFLSMWKVAPALSVQDALHAALDCGLSIQNNLGTYRTDLGVIIKVKVAISAGISYFSVIGGAAQSHYVIVGQPVWDVKMAEYLSTAGDVLTSASVWKDLDEAEYLTKPYGDGRHTKVLGVGNSWKRVEKIAYSYGSQRVSDQASYRREFSITEEDVNNYREFSLRPSVIAAIRSTWWPSLRQFMVKPVLRAVDNDEPMQFLAEVRRVVVVFLNIITRSVSEELLVRIVDDAYQCVCSVTSAAGGLVNKVSMFDKDMMFLVVFGLRGLKQEDEAQKALLCALTIKENLENPNITSVSIGITSGTTYCGVVGHVLRREYTVIGSAVNKAARLMIAYQNKVTCDKETFLRSKLDHEFFMLQKFKPLKGFHNPGPIYEFKKVIYPERLNRWRHPLIGRNEELRKFRETLDDAIKLQHQKFVRYRDHVYGIAFLGPGLVGKTRLMDECIILTPKNIQVLKITPKLSDRMPYVLFRQIAMKMLTGSNDREKCENKIRTSIDLEEMTTFQLFTLNTIFGSRFPLPEDFSYTGAILEDQKTRNMVQRIFKSNIPSLWIVAVDEVNNIDDESWQLLLILMEAKTIFAILNVCDQVTMSDVAYGCLSNNMILKLHLSGIERWYHAALACQLLDVQAIPADLEKVIQSASGGMPGWIHNFVISLIQRGALTVGTLTRGEAEHLGAVMPSVSLLQREDDTGTQKTQSLIVMSRRESNSSDFSPPASDHQVLELPSDVIQMAILDESYNFDAKVDMTMDALILKTYDSLTPFEKMFLKCSSVLGDVFSRRMLLHLLQSDSPRKVAQAVAKLFAIRVLECEGGDFTRETSMVLVHPAPALPSAKPPYCACLGIRQLPDCRDLPMYAFCGYMKFKHPLFRTTTYDLLTESQKREMHARSLLYLERYTRRCIACGAGCFYRLLGERCNDGLIIESKELIRTRDMMRALADETRVVGESTTTFLDGSHQEVPVHAYFREHTDAHVVENEELLELRRSVSRYRKDKHIRSFVSPELANCECLTIILSVYCQIIDHCRGAGEYKKLFEAYLEYADLCVMNSNVPQAIRLLFEVEAFVMNDEYCFGPTCNISWLKKFRLARILSLRGSCMLESGDLAEARKDLFQALELYNDPFPTSKFRVKVRGARASIRQFLTLRVVPKLYVATERGTIGTFYEEIAETLNRLHKLFSKCEETSSAYLAAKQAFAYALRTNSNFRVLCESYGNLITIFRQKKEFSMCLRFEKQAMDVCNRKRGELDATEVQAVCFLYTSLFLFYVEYGKKSESLDFGLSVVQMITSLTDQTTRQLLINWILKLLLSDLRIEDMVVLMREFYYLTDDMNSITWYHFYAMVILLDTGFCVESYQACEMFYIKKGDAILRSKTPDAAWYFFVSMWLITIRMGAWERGILWEDKIKQIMSMGLKKHAAHVELLLRLAEGFLIMLVREIDNRNLKKTRLLNKIVRDLFHDMNEDCNVTPIHRPRYFLLSAYYHIIRGNKGRAYKHLNKAVELAEQFKHGTILIWAKHTEQHWKGTLNPALIDYWVDHVEPDCNLDYRDFNKEYGKQIVPYTLPLPRDVERTK